MKKSILIALSVSLLAITSCETLSPYRQTHPLSAMSSSLQNTSWQMMTINGFESEQLDKAVTLTFTADKIGGFSGCNTYSADFTQQGANISFSEIISTMKACMVGSKTENAYLKALRNTTTTKLKDGHLHLLDNSGNDLVILVPVR